MFHVFTAISLCICVSLIYLSKFQQLSVQNLFVNFNSSRNTNLIGSHIIRFKMNVFDVKSKFHKNFKKKPISIFLLQSQWAFLKIFRFSKLTFEAWIFQLLKKKVKSECEQTFREWKSYFAVGRDMFVVLFKSYRTQKFYLTVSKMIL